MVENETHSTGLSRVLIYLMKGVLYQERRPEIWQDLLSLQSAVRDHFSIIGLKVFIDEAEGYAFLRQHVESDELDTPDIPLPRLVPKRALSYSLSLMCVLLRKKLIELDAGGGETRLILGNEEIIDMMLVFMPKQKNEAKTVEQIKTLIKKMLELGFLRKMKGDNNHVEVRRIIKAIVDADWLSNLDEKLQEYKAYADSTGS